MENSNTTGHIFEDDGTVWLYIKCDDRYGRLPNQRQYWVTYCNGPASRGIVGFYATSIEEARNKLNS